MSVNFSPNPIKAKVGESVTVSYSPVENVEIVSMSVSDSSKLSFNKSNMKIKCKEAGDAVLGIVYKDGEGQKQVDISVVISEASVSASSSSQVDLSSLEQYIDRIFLINKNKNEVSLLPTWDKSSTIYRNAVNTNGASNIRIFVPKKESLKQLRTILETYKNDII